MQTTQNQVVDTPDGCAAPLFNFNVELEIKKKTKTTTTHTTKPTKPTKKIKIQIPHSTAYGEGEGWKMLTSRYQRKVPTPSWDLELHNRFTVLSVEEEPDIYWQ